MFGQNPIVGRRFFNDAPEAATGKLLVTSMFYTLQGEGPLRGEPAFFIRLTHCNLACSFCDTHFTSGEWYSREELEREIHTRISTFFDGEVPAWADRPVADCWYGGSPVPRLPRQMALVITGGEPMLQPNLGPMLERLRLGFSKTQIETNGTSWQALPDDVILVCSPKCGEREGVPLKYLMPHARVLERANCLKFVMEAPAFNELDLSLEYTPYSTVPDWAHEWRQQTGRPIFISPMNIYRTEPKRSRELRAAAAGGTLSQAERDAEEVVSFWEPGLLDMEANRRNHEYAASYAIRHGCTFNLQTHLFASVA